MKLLEPILLGGREAPNRLMFGPHETNLGRGRAISDRHVAYYLRRAVGGAGIIVTEEASVHGSDWPYERAPLASACGPGWSDIADAVSHADTGTLVLAALGHAGGQGSTAYSQSPLWAPSNVPEVNTREVPKRMEADDITSVIEGFRDSARLAADAGLDGVEVNAGQFSLVRQFLSGLTNQRDDEWGTDRLEFARAVLAAARAGLDSSRGASNAPRLLGLRLSCDELAPWAGITPGMAGDIARDLVSFVDYVVVVRGSIFTASATRPDMHTEPGFNIGLCRSIRNAVRGAGSLVPVVLQGSVVEVDQAEWAFGDEVCDVVEMTRAQIADPAIGAKLSAGLAKQIRPCVLCNQLCQVRDARNPIVSCIGEPSSGHELDDPSPLADLQTTVPTPDGDLVIVGSGPGGLEAARTAALLGRSVRLVTRDLALGGNLAIAATALGRERFTALIAWWEDELARLGVEMTTGTEVGASDLADWADRGAQVILATGSIPGQPSYSVESLAAARVADAADFLEALAGDDDRFTIPEGDVVVVLDPIGGPIGVSIAEVLAGRDLEVHLVTQDNIAANELARTGDLAPANVRLQQAGVAIERRSLVRGVRCVPSDETHVAVTVEDRFGAGRRSIQASLVVDAGFRLPNNELAQTTEWESARVGDAVAPRTVHEAVLEARRAVTQGTGS